MKEIELEAFRIPFSSSNYTNGIYGLTPANLFSESLAIIQFEHQTRKPQGEYFPLLWWHILFKFP